jgi:GT2 family glycosyltransferase
MDHEKEKGITTTIAITTHNRLEDLRKTLNFLPRSPSREIIVCADGCVDGTQAFVRSEHPDVVLIENAFGQGSIPSRNRMIHQASGAYVLLLDDDSYPVTDGFYEEAERIMETHSDIAVLTFPQRSDEFPESLSQEDFGPILAVGTFTSSGSVIRKQVFERIGGFPGFFFHAYEEPDYSLRVMNSGYTVVLWTPLVVRHHYTGVMRNEGRTHRRHARNEFWSTLMRAPALFLPFALGYRVFSQFRYACRRGPDWIIREPVWWLEAIRGSWRAWKARKPVSRSAYRHWIRRLRQPEPYPLPDTRE